MDRKRLERIRQRLADAGADPGASRHPPPRRGPGWILPAIIFGAVAISITAAALTIAGLLP